MGLSRYCLLLCALVTTYGLKIDFTSTPTEGITVPFSEQLSLRCFLKNETVSINKILGALTTLPKPKPTLQHVTSIIVTRGSTHVASVTPYSPAQIFTDKDTLQATGTVSGLTQEDAYLELIWKFPTPTLAGAYRCEINAVDEFGHNVILTKSLQVENHPVNMTDVIDFILNINKDLIQVKHDLQSLHTETGDTECGSSGWTSASEPYYSSQIKRVTVNFTEAYNDVPKVATGLSRFHERDNYDDSIGVRVINVTKTDFTVECFTWTSRYNYDFGFFWISNN